jgi:hypothetical protein
VSDGRSASRTRPARCDRTPSPTLWREAVVDRLEVVDVDEQDRDGAVAAERRSARQRVLDALEEHRAVGEPRELVVEGLVGELALAVGKPLRHRVQRIGDLAELGERAELDAMREVATAEAPRRGAQRRERAGHAAPHPQGEADRDRAAQQERERQRDPLGAQLAAARRALAHLAGAAGGRAVERVLRGEHVEVERPHLVVGGRAHPARGCHGMGAAGIRRGATKHRPDAFGTSMTKPLSLTLAALLATLALLPSGASAKTNVRVGIGDQQVSMFDQPLFHARKFKIVRYFVSWNVLQHKDERLEARAYVQRARQDHIQVLLHISSDDLRIKRAKLPSVAQFRTQVKRLATYFRALGVRDFGAWNEVNHASQPTYRSPARAADFFVETYRAIKPRCSFCNVVALDVLDQAGVERYMRSFYRHLSPTYRRRATLVGIHNYGDVNRQRTTFTRSIIRQSHAFNKRTRFWFTETGGLVKFGRNFPCNQTRAKNRLRNMFALARGYRTSGVERLYIYNWTGPPNGCDARFDAGVVNFDGTPRPGYDYLRGALPNYLR